MCRQFFVAADEPIDTPYDPAVGELGWIVRLPEAKAGTFRAFTKPLVYAIIARDGEPVARRDDPEG